MAFKDFTEFRNDGLDLPIKGKVYHFESPDFETGILVNTIMEVGSKAAIGEEITDADRARLELDDSEEMDLMRRVMGDTYDELRADNAPWIAVQHTMQTLMLWITGADRDTLERFWSTGSATDPKALNREARRAEERSTRKPASTSGTSRKSTKKP